MDYLTSLEDVDAFMDKFQDPVYEIERIISVLNLEDTELTRCFIHKLLIKTYRLGKEHGYAGAAQVAKKRTPK